MTESPPDPDDQIVVPAGQPMVAVLGARDELLRVVEQALPSTDISVRGNEITISGAPGDVALAERSSTSCSTVHREGRDADRRRRRRIVTMLRTRAPPSGRPRCSPSTSCPTAGAPSGPRRWTRSTTSTRSTQHTIVFGIGPAGTGKTYLAMAKAVQALQAKQVNRIILTRPAVEAGERLGFLPGTLYEKIDPYLRPLYDALHDMIDPESIPRLMTAGTIEVAPLAYMRGRTLNDAFIILDEAQNTSPEQMKMFLTRLGFGSKIVVTGDVTQVDLPSGTPSGLRVVQEILEGVDDVSLLPAHSAGRRTAPAGQRHRRRVRPVGRDPAGHRLTAQPGRSNRRRR